MINSAQNAVREFNRLFNLPVSEQATRLSRERVELRVKWMSEEIEEFRKANNILDQLDAVTDLIYYAIGVFVEMGVDGSMVFQFVHEANMAKVSPGEKPRYNPDGKVMKPENWTSPREKIRRWLSETAMVS